MTLTIDLNADLGEECGDDAAMLDIVSSANIACGMHAGNLAEMMKVIALARSKGVRVGAHPSYPDRENFGRVSMAHDLDDHEFSQMLLAQLEVFNRLATYTTYIKPHGALYNDAAQHAGIAARLCQSSWRVPVMHMPGSLVHQYATENGHPFIAEVFADRAYAADGTLASRSIEGSVLHEAEEIAERVVRMVTQRTVEAIDGSVYEFSAVDSVCIHGDTPGSVAIARSVRAALVDAGVQIASRLTHENGA
jgi:5-oxoprolinase (ATP-hydrolysing) subunit A